MTLRTWLYSTLKNDATLAAFHGGRVFQGGALTSTKTAKPFLVYHVGNDTNEFLSDDHPAHRRFFSVYLHDVRGDYMKIDAAGERLKTLLNGAGSAPDSIITVRFLERSQDLTDEVLETIFNYIRFQAVMSL